MANIVFGTSGWRAILADEFTVANVRLCSQALAEYLVDRGDSGGLVVLGHDTRFMGAYFAKVVGEVLLANGFRVLQQQGALPTPALDHAVLTHKAVAGVCLTASHNPPSYQGFKVIDKWGGIALPDMTNDLTDRVSRLTDASVKWAAADIPQADFTAAYLDSLEKLVGKSARSLRILFNPMHGASAKLMPDLLQRLGHTVEVMRENQDPYFGHIQPDPTADTLADMRERMARGDYDLGLATDADGDRFGVLSAGGEYMNANDVLALLVTEIANDEGPKAIAMAEVTSQLVAMAAQAYGLDVVNTPVGFKFLGNELASGNVRCACEESSGFAWLPHVPDKDGLMACALVARLVARAGKDVLALRDDLYQKIGRRWYQRLDVALPQEDKRRLMNGLKTTPPQTFGGFTVQNVSLRDGVRLSLAGQHYISFRASGTEPLVRVYMDAADAESLGSLQQQVSALIG